jgi:chromosomal replication initiation ATPase DnaA
MEKRKRITNFIAKEFNVEEDFLSNKSRSRAYVYPKKVLMHILYNVELMSMHDVAMHCGYKNHTTALFHMRDIGPLCRQFDSFNYQFNKIFNEAKRIYTSEGDGAVLSTAD